MRKKVFLCRYTISSRIDFQFSLKFMTFTFAPKKIVSPTQLQLVAHSSVVGGIISSLTELNFKRDKNCHCCCCCRCWYWRCCYHCYCCGYCVLRWCVTVTILKYEYSSNLERFAIVQFRLYAMGLNLPWTMNKRPILFFCRTYIILYLRIQLLGNETSIPYIKSQIA